MFDWLRKWWRARSTVTIVMPPDGQVHTVNVSMSHRGDYTVSVDDTDHIVRARWWDTRASIARKLRRVLS